ncbi:MAG: DUF4397 domain-containing protein [Xanthomonadales bacterium]|nr:DUF4397 domain-containing protein [Xanthomonadales bacterium]
MNKLTAAASAALVIATGVLTFGQANAAVAHFAPVEDKIDGAAVAIAVNGMSVDDLSAVTFKQFTDYLDFAEGTYTIDILLAETDAVAIPGDFTLPDGANYSVFAAGTGTTQDLELITVVDDGINHPPGIIVFLIGELQTRSPVDNSTNGSWEIIEGSDTGFIFEPIPSQNRATGTGYTHDGEGSPGFFSFDSCFGGMATVRLDGEAPAMYTAANLTAAFCNDQL